MHDKRILMGGLDEVGWGCLAGPVVSVIVVVDAAAHFSKAIRDSKKMSHKQRQEAMKEIFEVSFDVGLGIATPEEFDNYSPASALMQSYRRALNNLDSEPDFLVVDGDRIIEGFPPDRQKAIPKADDTHSQVSAASIVAKVIRDEIMDGLGALHPQYGWGSNSGYGTPEHMAAIKQYGLLLNPHHHRACYCKRIPQP